MDYRKLTDVTQKDSYPLPHIDDSIDAPAGAEWFSTLDLKSGYWLDPLEEDAKEKKKSSFNRYMFVAVRSNAIWPMYCPSNL